MYHSLHMYLLQADVLCFLKLYALYVIDTISGCKMKFYHPMPSASDKFMECVIISLFT